MKNREDLHQDLNDLRTNLRKLITSYAGSFDIIEALPEDKIHFQDTEGCFEREKKIDLIIAEGSNVCVAPKSKKFMDHSENTIMDVHDLFMVLSIIENNI